MTETIAFILFGFVLGAVTGALIVILAFRSERTAEFTSKWVTFKLPGSVDKVGPAQIDAAFERMTDVAQGVVAVMDAPIHETATAARKWFDYLASCLSGALRTHPDELYRVAIWEDTGDPNQFVGIGWAMFDANDPAVERLNKNDTLAGIAFRSPEREYYCPDINLDKSYVPHTGRPRRYKSVFAVALGGLAPWGVMTVDGKASDGFTEADKLVVRRFAALVSVGYAAREEGIAERTPDPGK